MSDQTYPAWFYGPNEQSAVFDSEADVPKGWVDHPAKLGKKGTLDHDGDGEPGGDLPDSPPALTGKNKAELQEIAIAEGVEFSDDATNAELREAIEAGRAASEG